MTISIKKILTLLSREYWEHKILLLWLPLGITALVLVLQLGAGLLDLDEGAFNASYSRHTQVETEDHTQVITEHHTGAAAVKRLLFGQQADGTGGAPGFAISLTAFTLLISLCLIVALLIYAHGSLYGDRQRREMLFWHSLPVSEAQNLAVKLLMICVLLPAIYSLMLLVYGLGSLVQFPAWNNLLLLLVKVTNLTLGSILFTVIFLPLISWVLFCSAAARRSPIFLSLLLPMAVGLVLRMTLGTNYLTSVIGRYFSAVWDKVRMGPETLRQQVDFLTSTEFLPALLVSVVLLAACVWLRNHRTE